MFGADSQEADDLVLACGLLGFYYVFSPGISTHVVALDNGFFYSMVLVLLWTQSSD